MNAVDKQVAATIRKKKVNQLARSIRKKYLSLKLGKSENDETLNKLFKPVVDPLERIIKHQLASKRNQVVNPIAAAAATATAASAKAMKSITLATPPTTSTDPDDNDDDDVDYNDEMYEDAKVYDSPPDEIITTYINQYPAILKPFMMESIMHSKDDKIDKIYSPQYIRNTSTWKMGSKTIVFDKHGNISTGKSSYKGSPGLYQLIFYKEPQYQPDDLNIYKQLLHETGAHLNNAGKLKSSKQYKYLKIIKPILQRSTTTGYGLSVDKMSFNQKPIEYRYWDDPNELVERLKLLIAAKEAGNTSVQNEIVAIINELKESNIIY